MNTLTSRSVALALGAFSLGLTAAGSQSDARPAAAALASAPATVESGVPLTRVDHRRWRSGGVGIVIEPGYGYAYDDYDYGYYPRYRSYDDDAYYSYYDDDDRRYRRHSRKWVRERFEHPLGRK